VKTCHGSIDSGHDPNEQGAVLTTLVQLDRATNVPSFAVFQVRIGPVPAVISPFVVKAIGERATRRYALTAERFDAHAARALGLFADTCPREALEQRLEGWIDTLLLNSPQAMRACKDLLHEVESADLTPALTLMKAFTCHDFQWREEIADQTTLTRGDFSGDGHAWRQ
jgi:enoyl-CoA hydratase/carnithine racemase